MQQRCVPSLLLVKSVSERVESLIDTTHVVLSVALDATSQPVKDIPASGRQQIPHAIPASCRRSLTGSLDTRGTSGASIGERSLGRSETMTAGGAAASPDGQTMASGALGASTGRRQVVQLSGEVATPRWLPQVRRVCPLTHLSTIILSPISANKPATRERIDIQSPCSAPRVITGRVHSAREGWSPAWRAFR